MDVRDRFLDYLRGIAVLLVILDHAAANHKAALLSSPLADVLWHVTVVSVPVIVFVSGAALYHASRRYGSDDRFLLLRLKRLLLPYISLALLCSSLFYLREALSGQPLNAEHLISWLTLQPRAVMPKYVGWPLWFVPLALTLAVAHSGLIRLFRSERWRLPTAILLLSAVVGFTLGTRPRAAEAVIQPDQLLQYGIFYGLVMYAGYAYGSGTLQLPRRWYLTFACVALAGWAALTRTEYVSSFNYENRYPPNVGYLLVGAAWIALWLAGRTVLVGLVERSRWPRVTLRFLGTHSYTVYLYQGFAVWAVSAVGERALPSDPSGGIVTLLLSFSSAVALAIGLVVVIERAYGWLKAWLVQAGAGRRLRALVPAGPGALHLRSDQLSRN